MHLIEYQATFKFKFTRNPGNRQRKYYFFYIYINVFLHFNAVFSKLFIIKHA